MEERKADARVFCFLATQSGIGLERFASGRNATVFCHRLRAHPGTLYAVDNSGLQAGSTVLISGVGTIGALTVLSVNAAGASQIFVAEPNPARRKFIESWGLCAGVFDPTEDVPACIREQTTVGVDVAIECAGNENSLAACLRSVRRQGTVVQVGLATAACKIDLEL